MFLFYNRVSWTCRWISYQLATCMSIGFSPTNWRHTYHLVGPIPWGHSGPLCHALSLSLSSSSWTSMRRRRATVAAVATPGEWQCKTARSSECAQHFSNASCLQNFLFNGSCRVSRGLVGCGLEFLGRIGSGLGLRLGLVLGCVSPVDVICKYVCVGVCVGLTLIHSELQFIQHSAKQLAHYRRELLFWWSWKLHRAGLQAVCSFVRDKIVCTACLFVGHSNVTLVVTIAISAERRRRFRFK